MQINLHRAGLRTRPAQRRRVGQMLPILQAAQMRCDHRAHGSAVRGAVSVPAHVAEDGAHVQAGPAADAMQRVALFRVRQQFRAPVVQQHHVPFLRAVRLARLARTGIHRVVAGHRLARPGRREHRQKQRQIAEARQHFLDAQQRDHRLRQRGGEPCVALVLRDRDHPGLGDGKVRPREAHIRRDILLPHHPPRHHREFLGAVRWRVAQLAQKQFPDLPARQVHRGKHDVIRRLVAELHDEFAQVRFHHRVAGLFQGMVQVDLLRGHRLGLDDGFRLLVPENSADDVARLRRVAGPMHLGAVRLQFGRERDEMLVQMVDRFPLGFRRRLPRRFPALEGRLAFVPHRFIAAQRRADDLPVTQVARLLRGLRLEL